MSRSWFAMVTLLACASSAVGAAGAFVFAQCQNTTISEPIAVVVTEQVDSPPPPPVPQQDHELRQQDQSANNEVEPPSSGPEPSTDEPAQTPSALEAEQPGSEDSRNEPAATLVDIATLSPNQITQGESFSIVFEVQRPGSFEASDVVATVGGRAWSLSETEPGRWWGIVAVPRDAASGATDVIVDLYADGGVWLDSHVSTIMVLASVAPLEEVVLGGQGPALDPVEVQRDISVRFVEHAAVSGPPRWSGPWILPVEGEVTGVFGAQRTYDGVTADGWHHGHDIAAHHGDPIVAPAPAVVVWTGELILHGIGVILDHGAGVYSGYWHMSLISVDLGQEVQPGDWIGNIGTTGLSTGPHLHWEVIIQGVDVDPVQWLGDQRPPLS